MLQDSNTRVKTSAARVLSKVAENYPDCFYLHQDCQAHLQCIFDSLNAKPIVIKNVVWVLTFLTEQLPKITHGPIVTEKFKILQYLASTAVRDDIGQAHFTIIDTCFMGILNVTYSISDPALCKQYLGEFLKKLLECEKCEPERKKHTQSGLLTAMHVPEHVLP